MSLGMGSAASQALEILEGSWRNTVKLRISHALLARNILILSEVSCSFLTVTKRSKHLAEIFGLHVSTLYIAP